MPEEHPPLGKSHIIGFDSGSATYPILAVAKDPRQASYAVPAVGSTTGLSTEFISAYANNKFTHVQRISEQRVLWIYQRIPGYTTYRFGFDAETGARTLTTTQRVAVGTEPVPIQTGLVYPTIGGMYAIDGDVIPDEAAGSVVATRIALYMEVPPTRYEYSSEHAVCPALFEFISGWSIRPTPPFLQAGPFAGVNYTLTAKRTAVSTVTEISYNVGPAFGLPTLWQVTSPGAASRFFPISGDTIHNAILVIETAPDMSTQTVEDLPASTPTSYDPGVDEMILHASEMPYGKGGGVFYEKRVTTGIEA